MLPVSITAIMMRIIFKLKLADIVINITAGGPGGATDTVTSFIFREYRDRSNVGYGTLLAMVYLVIIVIFLTGLHAWAQPLDAAVHMTQAIFHDSDADRAYKAKWWTSRILIYGVLILWTIICLFPIYWTITTSFKMAPDVHAGPHHPVRRLRAGLAGLALARPVARHDRRRQHGPRPVHRALLQLGHRLRRRLGPGGRPRLASPAMGCRASATSSGT